MSGAFIMLLILALLLVLPAVLLVREVRALRAAGVSDSQPVCAKCRYRMRGWGSPICPECGSDVREVGIITGSARARGFAGQVAVIATVLVGGRACGQVLDARVRANWRTWARAAPNRRRAAS